MEGLRTVSSRRNFLGGVLAAAGLSATRASAMSRGDNALVCIYLFGGNDSNNMIVPLESYPTYAQARGPLALSRASLLPVRSRRDGIDYGFHEAMPEVRDLFERGTLGVVSNVGLLPAAAGSDPTALDRSKLTPPGPLDPDLAYFTPGVAVPLWAANMAKVTQENRSRFWTSFPELRQSGNPTNSVSLITPAARATPTMRDKLHMAARSAATGTPIEFPNTGLGQQLRQIASLIRASSDLRLGGQIYSCALSGFSTIAAQAPAHAVLLAELSSALGAFQQAMEDLGLSESVTVFTDSEHSRTLVPNKLEGTDPAWGGHQLVMGGNVLGGSVYGQFPNLMPGGPSDLTTRGVWIPSSSKDQYSATLANWYGLSHSAIDECLPGVATLSQRTLGFMVTG